MRSPKSGRCMLDYAMALEGLSRHTGVHAAGVVIAPGPVDDYVPVCTQASKGAGSSDEESVVVSQYDMNCLEKAGMLKMDFLGLTTLTVIHDALAAIAARTGASVDIDAIPLDDPQVYQMLRAGRTTGVFQFESPLATDMLRSMRCDRFDDLVASNALMRPGPLDAGMHRVYQRRKRGEESVVYSLPELEAILEPTYGVITYQEQVMRIAQVLAGMSLAEADVLRKAVGKKDADLLRHELGKFTERSVARGYDRRVIEELAGQIETFGRYGFPKAHSVAYSIISYQTAWLKKVHRHRRERDSFRTRRDSQRGQGGDRLHPRRAPRASVREFLRLLRPRRSPALQQTRLRGADRVGCARYTGRPPGPVLGGAGQRSA